MTLLERLDAYGTTHPGFREGHPEDRCPICDWPVADHGRAELLLVTRTQAALWPHRRAAAVALAGEWWDRTVIRVMRALR